MGLLAAEMTAVSGKTPDQLYVELTTHLGTAVYRRMDAVATPREKA